MRSTLVVLIFSVLLMSCTQEESTGELCSSATGAWDVSQVTCNGTSVTPSAPTLLSFDQVAQTVEQSFGDSDCVSSLTSFAIYGESTPIMSLTGTGNISCTQSGADISACTGSSNSCDNTTSIDNIGNAYTTCSFSEGSSITLSRIVSAQNVTDQVSYCADGQEEVITLVPQVASSGLILTISDGPGYDYGAIPTGTSTSHIFTVTNTGSQEASSLSASGLTAPFSFLGGVYPGTGGDCGVSLSASASCTVAVEFAPTSAGVLTDTIDIGYSDGAALQTAQRDITGTGASGAGAAVLTISESDPYNFGPVVLTNTSYQTFTIVNGGSVAATSIFPTSLATPYGYKGGGYPGLGGTCTASLSAGASCEIVIEFAPVSVAVVNDSIEINYNDGVTAQTVNRGVTGVGVSPALLVISNGPAYDFGSIIVGGTGTYVFTVNNTGGFTATALSEFGLSTPFGFDGGGYPGTGGSCGASLAPGANCTIVIEFSPVMSSSSSDNIEISYGSGAGTQVAVRGVLGSGS